MVGTKHLIAWWQKLPIPWRPWRVVDQVNSGDEVPERLPYKGVVIVGASRNPTWAAFDCPCRSGHRLMVNLDRRRHPFWNLDSLKPLTIRPSIDDTTTKRRCHFFVQRGRITWTHHYRRETE